MLLEGRPRPFRNRVHAVVLPLSFLTSETSSPVVTRALTRGWWPYIWSVRSKVRVDTDGTVPLGKQRVKITPTYRRTAIHCQHPDGSITYLAEPPGAGGRPIVLYRYENFQTPWNV